MVSPLLSPYRVIRLVSLASLCLLPTIGQAQVSFHGERPYFPPPPPPNRGPIGPPPPPPPPAAPGPQGPYYSTPYGPNPYGAAPNPGYAPPPPPPPPPQQPYYYGDSYYSNDYYGGGVPYVSSPGTAYPSAPPSRSCVDNVCTGQ